jgi:hypothetical protein
MLLKKKRQKFPPIDIILMTSLEKKNEGKRYVSWILLKEYVYLTCSKSTCYFYIVTWKKLYQPKKKKKIHKSL